MASMGSNQQRLPNAEIAGLGLIGELQPGTALKQQHPLQLLLVVPEALSAGRPAGMDPLEPQSVSLQQHLHQLRPGRRAGASQQIAIPPRRGGGLTPTASDGQSELTGQIHHLVMAAAIAQALAQQRILLHQRHKRVELLHLRQELLQLRFSHHDPLQRRQAST